MRRKGDTGLARLASGLAVMLVASSVTAIGVVGTAQPAGAGNGDRFLLHVYPHDNYCLVPNGLDLVVTWCVVNEYSTWRLWFGGFVQNWATKDCLTLMPGWSLKMLDCSDPTRPNRYQVWQQWDNGWIRNPTDGVCVQRWGDGAVSATPCSQTYSQYWHQFGPLP